MKSVKLYVCFIDQKKIIKNLHSITMNSKHIIQIGFHIYEFKSSESSDPSRLILKLSKKI